MFTKFINLVEQLNFSYPKSFVGIHFWEIIALLSIVFGGSFLLFGYRHHKYFLGITGLLVGGWLGLILKNCFSPDGVIVPFIYMAVCGTLGCVFAIFFEKFVGILLGGFTMMCIALIFFPALFTPGHETYIALSLSFLLGGGLGAIFPRFFFIVNSALIGTVFVTYGISTIITNSFFQNVSNQTQVAIHLLVFLPIFIFGILYQMKTTPETEDNKSPKKAEPSTSKA